MLGKTEGRRRSAGTEKRWLDGITDSKDMNLSKLREIVKDSKAWGDAVHGVAKSWIRLNNDNLLERNKPPPPAQATPPHELNYNLWG